MIDLHCHSTFSDGQLHPRELCQAALAAGVKLLALTDHDTLAGLNYLEQAMQNEAIQLIKGIELSISWKKIDLHILGLNINSEDKNLLELIARQNEARVARAKAIANCLEQLNLVDVYAKACQIAGHERLARPHFAKLLVQEGIVPDLASAFKRFLKRGRPAYVPTVWASLSETISIIRGAGGQAVLAHPLKYRLTAMKLNSLLADFKEAGGVGLEVVSGEMTASEINQAALLCQRYELLASSGSDFHGGPNSRISLGRQAKLPLNCQPIWQPWIR